VHPTANTSNTGVATAEPLPVIFAKPDIGDAERAAVQRVLESGMLAQGPEVAAFEKEFALFVGARNAVAVNSGTAALEVVLDAHDIGPGDEVIVPAFTFIATAATVARRGAIVRFADVDPVTFCLDRASVVSRLTELTRLVVPVHLYGAPAQVDALRATLPGNIAILEDAAQSHGTRGTNHMVGGSGTATFSFYPTKSMTTGEGGIVATDDDLLAKRLRRIRNHGMDGNYEFREFGTNLRMTDIGAAIGRCQLQRLPGFLERRAEIANRYLSELAGITDLELPSPTPGHSWSAFTIRHSDRDRLAAHLSEQWVASKVYYPESLDELPLFDSNDHCPNSAELARAVLSLPIRPDLTDDEVSRVIAGCRSF
jgi:perosamine synthetase